jgi:pyruvate dehydrogenase E2 component (dihydrolipoamide acetyltransferase)
MSAPLRFRFSSWWIALPLLAGLWPMLDHPRPRPPHRAEWLDAGGSLVRTVRAGEGDTTILLIHGFGESLTTWRAVFDPLASRARVIALDLPGFGGSSKPDTLYSLPAMTERLSRFIDEHATGTLVVMGHSMGGELAASLALARPDRVKLLILIAPAGYRIGLGWIVDTMYPRKAATVGRYLGLRSFITPIHDPGWLGEPDSMENYDLTGDPTYERAAARVLQEFDFVGLRDRFRDLTQPTLLIWGGNDPVIPIAAGDTISRLIPCLRYAPLATAFHRPHAEMPDTVLAIIRGFLRDPTCHSTPRG